jgi:hypothetical protein
VTPNDNDAVFIVGIVATPDDVNVLFIIIGIVAVFAESVGVEILVAAVKIPTFSVPIVAVPGIVIFSTVISAIVKAPSTVKLLTLGFIQDLYTFSFKVAIVDIFFVYS